MKDWNQVNNDAKILFDQKKYSEAVELLDDYLLPEELLPNLAKCLYYNKQAEKSLHIINVLSILNNSNLPDELLIDKALYMTALGQHKEAMKIYIELDKKDIETNTSHKVKFNLGWHYLKEGNFEKGFEYIQHGKFCRAWGNEYDYLERNIIQREKRWEGQQGHLLYILEGGLGDQIIFLRYVNYLEIEHKVTVACDRSLMRLLVNSGYSCIPLDQIQNYKYDFYIPAMAYPAMAKYQYPNDNVIFPYISSFIDVYHISTFYETVDSKIKEAPKIGIKWQGNQEFEHDQMRTIPSSELKEIASRFGIPFSFQFEDKDPNILNFSNIIKDWQDTYSNVMQLDLVITSCTSIAHLCGAAGVQCIVIVPLVSYFTWASDDIKWYNDNVRIIRQTEYNDWSGPMKELEMILEKMYA